MTKEVIFTSPSRKLKIKVSGQLVRFTPAGMVGIFKTSDEILIEALKKLPQYGRIFDDKGRLGNSELPNVIRGIRTSSDLPELRAEVENAMITKFHRYDELKSKLIKRDGSPMADADPVELEEYNALKTELKL